jgi:hypothetical protein
LCSRKRSIAAVLGPKRKRVGTKVCFVRMTVSSCAGFGWRPSWPTTRTCQSELGALAGPNDNARKATLNRYLGRLKNEGKVSVRAGKNNIQLWEAIDPAADASSEPRSCMTWRARRALRHRSASRASDMSRHRNDGAEAVLMRGKPRPYERHKKEPAQMGICADQHREPDTDVGLARCAANPAPDSKRMKLHPFIARHSTATHVCRAHVPPPWHSDTAHLLRLRRCAWCAGVSPARCAT